MVEYAVFHSRDLAFEVSDLAFLLTAHSLKALVRTIGGASVEKVVIYSLQTLIIF